MMGMSPLEPIADATLFPVAYCLPLLPSMSAIIKSIPQTIARFLTLLGNMSQEVFSM
jgi:hypothetical protein